MSCGGYFIFLLKKCEWNILENVLISMYDNWCARKRDISENVLISMTANWCASFSLTRFLYENMKTEYFGKCVYFNIR
jgi:hypothetical protein